MRNRHVRKTVRLEIHDGGQCRHCSLDEHGDVIGCRALGDQRLATNVKFDARLVQLPQELQVWIALGIELRGVSVVVQDRQCCIAVKDDSDLHVGWLSSTAGVDVYILCDLR